MTTDAPPPSPGGGGQHKAVRYITNPQTKVYIHAFIPEVELYMNLGPDEVIASFSITGAAALGAELTAKALDAQRHNQRKRK